MNRPLFTNRMNRRTRLNRRKRGLTLIELMVVIGIMLTIAAVAIPTVRFLTRDREIREAVRMLSTFVDSVRNDAVVDGQAGLWIERSPLDSSGNRAIHVFRAKFPPPYRGDTYNAQAYIEDTGFFYHAHFDMNSGDHIFFATGGIQAGDEIRFENRGTWYLIQDLNANVPHPNNGSIMTYQAVLMPVGTPTNAGELNGQRYPRLAEGSASYEIRRHPTKDSSRFIEMPEGTFIDLLHSGFDETATSKKISGGRTQVDFDSSGAPVPSTLRWRTRMTGGYGSGSEFASYIVDPAAATPPAASLPPKTKEIVITFGADGSLEKVYFEYYDQDASGVIYDSETMLNSQMFTTGNPLKMGIRPSRPIGNIYLLLAIDTQEDSTQPVDSLLNLSNRWLVISRGHGKVTTSEITTQTNSEFFDRRNESRVIAKSGVTEGG